VHQRLWDDARSVIAVSSQSSQRSSNSSLAFAAAAAAAAAVLCSSREAHADEQRIYSRAEVSKHKTPDSLWVTYKEGVYDVTSFLANHPGGKDRLMLAAGKDLSELWKLAPYQQHFRSPLAFELLEEMRIGTLVPEDVVRLDTSQMEREPLKYPTNVIYDCIIVGSGVSGLQTAKSLIKDHHVPAENILVLEAQDYIGGRVRQMDSFVRGVKIDVGAEFLHGNNTLLTKFAEENNEPVHEIYCWAHGDGGPLEEPVGKGYGLYWLNDGKGRKRLLRFDDADADFVRTNEALWGLADLKEDNFDDSVSLHDYLSKTLGLSDEMLMMAEGGFANTLCTNSRDLSLKQCIRWCRLWHGDGGEDGDYGFERSYSCLVDHLKDSVQVETSSPVTAVQYPESEGDVLSGLVKLTAGGAARKNNYYARTVVITSSPHVLKSGIMHFEPPLSPELRAGLETTNMHNIVKVFLKFSKPVWPRNLHGMIMTDPDFLVPEMWFRNVEDKAAPDEEAKAYAVGFTTAAYAARVAALPKEEVLRRSVKQLDEIFSNLEPRHMDASGGDGEEAPSDLPKPSEAYLGGMFWDWNPQHHPYIGGGYCSPKAGTPTHLVSVLAKPYGKAGNVYFAGEATNLPGATAHAALESGVRSADFVAKYLEKGK